jgi:PhnB protein
MQQGIVMPQLDAYLMFDGDCAQAMRFYQSTLGGDMETMMTFADSPMSDKLPPGSGERIIHARLRLDDRFLMASDTIPGMPYDGMKGFSLSLNYPSIPQAQKIFDALAEGGQVNMAMQKTFWAEAFGMLVDRFGTPWMIGGGMLTV